MYFFFRMFKSNACINSLLCLSIILNFRKSLSKKIDSMKASQSLYLFWNGYYLYSEENQIVILNDQYNNSETRYLHLIILVWRCYWVFDWWTKNNVSTCICINKLNKAYFYPHWRYNFWYSVFKLKNTRIIIFLKHQHVCIVYWDTGKNGKNENLCQLEPEYAYVYVVTILISSAR